MASVKTSDPLEFGIRLPASGPLGRIDILLRVATAAQQLNFDHVWFNDYIEWSREMARTHVTCGSVEAVDATSPDTEPLFMESLSTLAFVAGAVPHIRLGTSVLGLPLRDPVVLAKELASIDYVTGGRLMIGVGAGAARRSGGRGFEVLGVARTGKFARTREMLGLMTSIWTTDPSTFIGESTSVNEASIYPKPVQKPYPPIYFGGRGPKSILMAAEYGNGLLLTTTPEGCREHLDLLLAAAEPLGVEKPFEIVASLPTCIASTDEEARTASTRTVVAMSRRFHEGQSVERVIECSLIGSQSHVLDRIMRYQEAGVRRFELRFICHSEPHLLEQMRLFSEVIDRVGTRDASAGA